MLKFVPLYAKGLVWSLEENTSNIFVSISCMFNSKNSFQPIFYNLYLSNEKSLFADNWRAKPTLLPLYFHGKNIISIEAFIWPFYGQYYNRTARGPLNKQECIQSINTTYFGIFLNLIICL